MLRTNIDVIEGGGRRKESLLLLFLAHVFNNRGIKRCAIVAGKM